MRPKSPPTRRVPPRSLTRSEEMHRLTENVYKVSYAPHTPSRPPGADPGPSGVLPALSRRPSAGPAEVRSGPLAPTASCCPRAPFRESSACAGAGAFGPELHDSTLGESSREAQSGRHPHKRLTQTCL